MREGEINGKDYFFVSKEEFLTMVERDELLEYLIDRKTETKETLLVRVATAREEVKLVVNEEGRLERSAGSVEAIIDAEKARVRQRNAAWLQMAANSVFHEWTKHIETALHFICQRIQSRVLGLVNPIVV
ncbi:hypothetical protein RJ640_002975 [Escallonia rubra]|uniref:Guanylate kinase-like domain-containing protein n=1 Tax=Escallonia rubra TaxID=112253 RepID=A0AA88REI8_9ASTE|nr:hypothetical protein RJ640_002975 [Escallonia rubra]